jgi:hypothetical protein
MGIRDPFAHEAAHALVYDVLDMPVARVWVQAEADDARREGGKTERGTDSQMTPGTTVLEFMSGAGVLVQIFGQSFEHTINKIKSDLCTMVRLFGSGSEEEARIQLERFRIATQDFVGEWVLTNKYPIMKLATLLQQSPVGDKRWELSGSALLRAMELSWGGSKASASFTRDFADTRWKKILNRAVHPNGVAEWHTIVLRHCSENDEPPQQAPT